MDWLAVSIAATIAVSGAPMILAESYARASGSATPSGLGVAARARGRLRFATAAALSVFAVWFWLDRGAVAAGQRSFAVAIANGVVFVLLFTLFAARVLWPTREIGSHQYAAGRANAQGTIQTPVVATSQSAERAADFAGVTVMVAILVALLASTNDLGYRIKGGLIAFGGLALYYLGRQRLRRDSRLGDIGEARPPSMDDSAGKPRRRASRSFVATLVVFAAFEIAAALTLGLDWTNPMHRWIGVGSQVAVGILGLVRCAEELAA